MRVEIVCLAVACTVVAGVPSARGDEPDRAAPRPSLAEGREGLVVGLTGKRAVHAGLEILKQGGGAADAATATAMVQIVEAAGSYVSFAGIFSMVYYDASTKQFHYLNAGFNTPIEETDPLSIPKMDPLTGGGPPSGRTALVPGFMAGVQAARDRFGKLPMARIVEPAIALADDGFEVDPQLVAWIAFRKGVLGRLPETKRVFTRAGRRPSTAAATGSVSRSWPRRCAGWPSGRGRHVHRRLGAPLRRRRAARRREDHPARPGILPGHLGGADRDDLPRRPRRRARILVPGRGQHGRGAQPAGARRPGASRAADAVLGEPLLAHADHQRPAPRLRPGAGRAAIPGPGLLGPGAGHQGARPMALGADAARRVALCHQAGRRTSRRTARAIRRGSWRWIGGATSPP